jgi:hypothetical protein
MTDKRRSEDRTALSIALRVMGTNVDGTTWEEITASSDLSKRGLSCTLKKKVKKGHLVLIACAMPKVFRKHDLNEASYRVYALIRAVAPEGTVYRVGVLFLGKNPPRDHEKQPGGIYLMPGDEPPDRRHITRYTVFLTLRVTRTNAGGATPDKELTVAEDLSAGGARVPTALPIAKGEVVLVEEVGGDFMSRAEVRNTFLGPDKIARLNLKFLDGRVPPRLLT